MRVYENENGTEIFVLSIISDVNNNSNPLTKAFPALNGSSSPKPPVAAGGAPSGGGGDAKGARRAAGRRLRRCRSLSPRVQGWRLQGRSSGRDSRGRM